MFIVSRIIHYISISLSHFSVFFIFFFLFFIMLMRYFEIYFITLRATTTLSYCMKNKKNEKFENNKKWFTSVKNMSWKRGFEMLKLLEICFKFDWLVAHSYLRLNFGKFYLHSRRCKQNVYRIIFFRLHILSCLSQNFSIFFSVKLKGKVKIVRGGN